jgi:hypothetical protein|tara:strand:+ start:7209 stop:7553 length:345 start_codon:yes stop_codon:yes gene_type:complete
MAKIGFENGVMLPIPLSLVAVSSNKALALTDADTLQNVSTGANITVDTNANVAFEIGTSIIIYTSSASACTIVAAGGVTINSENGLILNAQYAVASITKIAADTWVAYGSLKAA